ncbi:MULTISPECIES: amidase [Ralstonia solanacearum species complex]|uniref:amidase n=1 Tax=Ralstonia solanacearum species complex TaxID=3116862 RepID=UPI000E59110C|nr:amidase family protein [Ralstonia solanacearum]BEU75127.1 amidase [Ralstonia pseudosolanacearum]AXV79892.1 amidase [Ralstonia solanacearum]AXV93926.1 amidase [Ralstonia solanacearum]AXW21907.1 amidase [Ralstonia solanacearum]AXW78819.1 amidase [Ralstonia solanacearum]
MSHNAELVGLCAVELRRMIGARTISPVELLEACIERIEIVNPAVNAVTATCYPQAREAARAAERAVLDGEPLGLLHGLPLGVKDLEDTAGLLTTYGSPTARANVPARDVLLVERLRAAGAVLVAKTNVPEFGAGANTRNPVWGATGNPFNPMLNAGGSSGGAAAALACDMLPVCTGSDTGGSLRIPAAKCGVVGFRPSPGLVPNTRKLLGWTPLSVVGPMGRTVAEACLQLAATAGLSAGDPLSYDADPLAFATPAPIDLGTLRVGWTEDFGCCDVDAGIRALFRERMAAIAPMFRLCEPVRFELGDVHRCFDVVRAESFVAGMRDAYSRDPASLGPNTRANYELGAAMTLADCAWAHAEQTRILKRFQAAFAHYDVILSPTTPVSPFPWSELYAAQIDGRAQENYYRWLALTYVVTLTTHPALSLPCGVDHAGMPFGLQIVGPFRGDRKTLAVAHALEQACEASATLRRPRPDLSRLAQPTPALKSIVTAPPVFDAAERGMGTSAV